MKFEKIKNGDKIEYYINDKPVDENTYNILLKDESVNKIPHIKNKFNNEDYENLEFNINFNQCMCEQCQEIRKIVKAIKELEENEGFKLLSDYIEYIENEISLSTLISIYSQIGNHAQKLAARLENQLEDFRESYRGGIA